MLIYLFSYFLVLFSDEPHEVDQRHKIVGLLGLFILQHQIYKGIDRRFFSKFWDIHKKVGFRLDPHHTVTELLTEARESTASRVAFNCLVTHLRKSLIHRLKI